MTTAFVLSGGGSLGSVQVGMLQALAENDIHPDLLIGTSAGAINSAYLAGHGTTPEAIAKLGEIWRDLRRGKVFPLEPIRLVGAMSGLSPSLFSNHGLSDMIKANLNYVNLEDAKIHVHLVATNFLGGQEVLISHGDALSAVLASAAIPGIYPAVEREGLVLVDGGVADNTAVSQAVTLGADEVYVLPAGFACDLDHAPTSVLGNAMQALTLLIEQRLIADVGRYSGHASIKLLPPLCPLSVPSTDFNHAAELMERSYHASLGWISGGGFELPASERFLSLHHHADPVGDAQSGSDQPDREASSAEFSS